MASLRDPDAINPAVLISEGQRQENGVRRLKNLGSLLKGTLVTRMKRVVLCSSVETKLKPLVIFMLMRSVCHDVRAFEHATVLTRSRQATSPVITSEDQMLILILTII